MPRWTQESHLILLTQLPIVVGRAEDCDLWLTEPSISRRHAQLERGAAGLVVRDLGSRFGTYVNGVRVVEKAVRPGDQVRFGLHLAYLVRQNSLEQVEAEGAALVLEEVAIERGGRRLVEGIAARMQSRQLIGILGPSGVGKTQLLRVLAGLFLPAAGQVMWQNTPVQEVLPEYVQQLGYIPQQDILYDTLTVEENVAYAAALRLRHLSSEERAERVSSVLELVQLGAHREKLAKVLSGGQRKRVSVAVELLRRPAILLLDEPTTGLDPANEARLIQNLRQIAQQGTLVICTSHSPGIVRMFDQVLVLALRQNMARQLFYGRPENLLDGLGIRDWVDLYEMLEHERRAQPSGPAGVRTGAEGTPGVVAARKEQEAGTGLVDTPRAARALDTAQEQFNWGSADSLPLGRDFLRAQRKVHRRQSAGWARQYWHVGWRCLTMIRRDPLLTAMMLGQPLLLGLLVVLTQYNPGKADPIFFFTTVIAIWLGLNNSVRDLVRERRQYIRDSMAGLRSEAYLGAKIGVYMVVGLAQLVLLVLVVRIGAKLILSSEAEHIYQDLAAVGWLWWIGIGMLVYACGLGLGLAVSTFARTEEAAVAALPMLMLPQILLSAVATGDVKAPVTQPRAFLPIVATLSGPPGENHTGQAHASEDGLSAVQWVVDVLSLACYSRPALLVLAPVDMTGKGYSRGIWWGDFFHLLILSAVTYGALWVGFLVEEAHWLRRLGL